MLPDIKRDFEFINDSVKGVLLFGSCAKDERSKSSDIDVCLVSPEDKSVLLKVFERLGGKYDIKIFEDLPLTVKMSIINKHQTVFGDEIELSHYFYRFRKEWADAEPRIRRNTFSSAREMIRQRRAWLDGRKISQKA
ncbi:MAG: nucleotidyltransferase domain-containing protein [Methanosarcinales archaeon Met12]|nr:MAG: nucleotidyltransferase domain-containing protein [Methanosarcinales archaeon Met12]